MQYYIETRLHCECGLSFTHQVAGMGIPLRQRIEQQCNCPKCGKNHKYAYEFEAEFACRKKLTLLQRIVMKVKEIRGLAHCVEYHVHHDNENSPKVNLYPRLCTCGAEILLKQRRVY